MVYWKASKEKTAMKFSTKSRYALRLMAELARYAPGSTVSLKEISERQQLSLKYLEQIAWARGFCPFRACGAKLAKLELYIAQPL